MTLINVLWFIAGHLSAAVLAVAFGRHAVENHRDNPWYKDGFREGAAVGRATARREFEELQREVAHCQAAIKRYERLAKVGDTESDNARDLSTPGGAPAECAAGGPGGAGA